MIYFDNAATSFPKPACVLKTVNKCIKSYCGNSGRSSHRLALKSAEEIYLAREEIASLLGGVDPENIVFTYNATYALNIAIKTLTKEFCHVITSDFEHNSVARPLESLKATKGIEVSSFTSDNDISREIKEKIKKNTDVIVSTVASNVTGESLPLNALSSVARDNKLSLIIDASQALGHSEINLLKTPCDALCAPGHKALFGIQGCGFVYFKNKERRDSFIEGGNGVDSINPYMPLLLPEGYEAGTLSTPAIVSLRSGIRCVKAIGIDKIGKRLSYLTDYTKELLSEMKNLKVYKSENGIVSFNVGDYPSSYIASKLDKRGICTRPGLHCSPAAHKRLGTLGQGTVRLSYSWFNTEREIKTFAHALGNIIKEL